MTGRRGRSFCSICGARGVNRRTHREGMTQTQHRALQRDRQLKPLPRPPGDPTATTPPKRKGESSYDWGARNRVLNRPNSGLRDVPVEEAATLLEEAGAIGSDQSPPEAPDAIAEAVESIPVVVTYRPPLDDPSPASVLTIRIITKSPAQHSCDLWGYVEARADMLWHDDDITELREC